LYNVAFVFLGICVFTCYEVTTVCAASEQCIGRYKSAGIITENQWLASLFFHSVLQAGVFGYG
jgi:hypothetical protein